jgi:hypothetical protein
MFIFVLALFVIDQLLFFVRALLSFDAWNGALRLSFARDEAKEAAVSTLASVGTALVIETK